MDTDDNESVGIFHLDKTLLCRIEFWKACNGLRSNGETVGASRHVRPLQRVVGVILPNNASDRSWGLRRLADLGLGLRQHGRRGCTGQ